LRGVTPVPLAGSHQWFLDVHPVQEPRRRYDSKRKINDSKTNDSLTNALGFEIRRDRNLLRSGNSAWDAGSSGFVEG
jgi:hypothetical protein